ncbi:hypothetical protein [Terriglobus saanensis]|uniref:Cytochrome c domain-containing protein n=1 Tax=Terriglobus saanensis (strain ATCC BAA-1853 / DSM 23119 / SP1PR4) TaxID=401053 RepID=E8V2G4_TERSS|nr:hypothetical protein [Terriglobus saanensis]ADV82382.1 hypothetical protein AciPR4_1561 [Terriglobus saanensis SP1PR4]
MTVTHSKKYLLIVGLLLLTGILAGLGIWYKMFRVAAQPAWINANARNSFLYGSVDAEKSAGIPYWIWLTLPRIFPEYLPGPGGYASLGFSWEETLEMPVGFSKRTVGYVRVAGNCALCHAYSTSNGPDAAPTVFAAGPGHTAEVQRLLAFYKQCAQDPRFNADNLLDEISMATKLSVADKLIYRYILIPKTRERFLQSDIVIVDSALWQHSQNPRSGTIFRKHLQDLETGLKGQEKDQLDMYLKTLR